MITQGDPDIQDKTAEDNREKLKRLREEAKKKRHASKDNPTTDKKEDVREEITLPFQVLGFNTDRKILVWHKGHLMSFSIPQLRSDEFELFIKFPRKEDGTLIDDYSARFKNRIIKEAREMGIIDETDPIKMGIWFINNKWLIVTGKTAVEISNGVINEINFPVYEGKIIKFGKQWLNVKKLKEKFKKSTLKDVYEKIYKYVSQWCWKEKDAPNYIAAIIMIIAFQHAMKWRPWVYISGETGTGKSLFLEDVLELLFSNLIKRADKTTEHAIYQAVGNTSRILCLDEFEKSRHIPQIMEALKLMSRGGEKNTGTPGEKEISFLVHHLPILASIYKPATCLRDESQRNRIITFELVKPKERTPPSVWREEEAEEILTELIAAVINQWGEIQQKADDLVKKTSQIKQEMEGKIDDRTVNNFMYASAILELVTGQTHTVPKWSKAEKKSDGQGIIEKIIFSKVKNDGADYLIFDLIDITLKRDIEIRGVIPDAKNILRQHGLTIVERDGKQYLAIHTENVMSHLLRSTDEFKGVDISLPLERLTGAERKKATFGGNSSLSTIQIPMTLIDELRGIEQQ